MKSKIAHILESTNTWPIKEARLLLEKKIKNTIPKKGYVLFETGYGPSGLPHIGTFGEVVRTAMVQYAFSLISDIPTKLICFSDDMDGMRKIPDIIENKSKYNQYMDLPLTKVPDPFDVYDSFGANMNARLRKFLDNFGFEYEFRSATDCYKNGTFNEMLISVLKHYDEIMDVMLPSLRDERRQTYSPFLPISQKTGKVLQVPILERDMNNHMISYRDPFDNTIVYTKITDGMCKLQWKPDLGMRWAAFDVDFEMYGKDHLVNGVIYSKICQIIGGVPPQQMFYELFLDENGQKISKSKGNGINIEEWLKYAPKESLALLMYNSPQKAKKLSFNMIPKYVDDYMTYLTNFGKYFELLQNELNIIMNNTNKSNIENKSNTDKSNTDKSNIERCLSLIMLYIYNGYVPKSMTKSFNGFSYSLLLNLISACNTEDPRILLKFLTELNNLNDQSATNYTNSDTHDNTSDNILDNTFNLKFDTSIQAKICSGKYTDNDINDDTNNNDKDVKTIYSMQYNLVLSAIQYYKDFLSNIKQYSIPSELEKIALNNLKTELFSLERSGNIDSAMIQNIIYEIAKKYNLDIKQWFIRLYEILLGAKQGPRFGSFIYLYGINNTITLIDEALLRND